MAGDSVDGTADVVVAGDTVVTVSTGRGPQGQGLDLKVDTFDLATGAPLASRTLGSANDERAGAVTVVGDQIVVGGYTLGSMATPDPARGGGFGDDNQGVVVALDASDLSTRWVRQNGSAYVVSSLTPRDGVVYWAGSGAGADSSTSAGLVGAISADGTALWQGTVGAEGAALSSITTTSRDVVLGGQIESRRNRSTAAYLEGRGFDGRRQWDYAMSAGGYAPDDVVAGVVAPADRVFFVRATTYGLFRQIKHGVGSLLGALDVETVLRPDVEVAGASARVRTVTAPAPRVVVRRGSPRTAVVQVRNRGIVGNRIALQGCQAPGLTMTWRAGARDVTAQVEAGTFRTAELAPKKKQALTWRVKATKQAPQGAVACSLVATSAQDAKSTDSQVVTIVVKPAT